MKKSECIPNLVSQLEGSVRPGMDPYYAGYFTCFNATEYYEAHDVLEHLWLRCHDVNRPFYQGLIQIAGAFVHLQKQYLRPDHPKDGRRMHPAIRLFELGMKNIRSFGPHHLHLNVEGLCGLCGGFVHDIQAGGFQRNPWNPASAPQLQLEDAP